MAYLKSIYNLNGALLYIALQVWKLGWLDPTGQWGLRHLFPKIRMPVSHQNECLHMPTIKNYMKYCFDPGSK